MLTDDSLAAARGCLTLIVFIILAAAAVAIAVRVFNAIAG